LLEPDSQPVAIGTILKPSRPVDQCSGDPLEAEFEKRAIMDFEQPIRDVNSVTGSTPIRWASKADGGASLTVSHSRSLLP